MMRSINSGLLEKRSVLSHRWAMSQSEFDRTVASGASHRVATTISEGRSLAWRGAVSR